MAARDLPAALLTHLREEIKQDADANLGRAAKAWLAKIQPSLTRLHNTPSMFAICRQPIIVARPTS